MPLEAIHATADRREHTLSPEDAAELEVLVREIKEGCRDDDLPRRQRLPNVGVPWPWPPVGDAVPPLGDVPEINGR